MKPSLRIQEIYNSKDKAFSSDRIIARSLDAVIQYLDEEWEKNKPCEHRETEAWNDYSVCKKCKRLVG